MWKKLYLLFCFIVCFFICMRIEDKVWIYLCVIWVFGFDLLVCVGFVFCLEWKFVKIRWIEMVLFFYRNLNGKMRKVRRRSCLILGIVFWIWFFFIVLCVKIEVWKVKYESLFWCYFECYFILFIKFNCK